MGINYIDYNKNPVRVLCKDGEFVTWYAIIVRVESHYLEATLWNLDEWDLDIPHILAGEQVLRANIKWDGCSHLWFEEYLHLCGGERWKDFNKAMSELFKLGAELIESWDDG